MIQNIRPWQPTATIDTLKKRARFNRLIRNFFDERGVMEVETPSLAQGTVTAPYLDALSVNNIYNLDAIGEEHNLFLQTSPEYHMKRLLAAGSGPIFQLCKAFRNDDHGRHHNPEFSILEWYRPNWSANQLMDEIDALMQSLLKTPKSEVLTYQQAMQKYLSIDPLTALDAELLSVAQELPVLLPQAELTRDELLHFMFSFGIEPNIGLTRPCFVTHFPASQAALAKLDPQDERVALRFELYYQKVELANGFEELIDIKTQLERFYQDNEIRKTQGLAEKPIDFAFLAALEAGLPECSGVALGVDRLLMIAVNAASIAEVISFAHPRA